MDSSIIALGPAGTYCHQAALQFASADQIQLRETISDVIFAVAQGKAERGIVPIENSIEGIVSETLDGLSNNNMVIQAEYVLDINHSLCVSELPFQKEQIGIVYSHPQALAQCREYIRANFPIALTIATTSTVAALQEIVNSRAPDAVAIGPAYAAQNLGLVVADEQIQDEANNQTRFVVFSQKAPAHTVLDFTQIVAIANTDRPGLLDDILTVIREQNINLSQIDSRPSRRKLGSYQFYITLDAPSNDVRIGDIVSKLADQNVIIQKLTP
jgi:prephenate dehydratase